MSDNNRRVPDTSKITPETARVFLAEALLTGDPSFPIVIEEKEGQRALIESTQLPLEGSPGHGFNDLDWSSTGIEFGPVEPGELFRDAKLPRGWAVKPTGHALHSNLVDRWGRKRATIFYKAAFYDRKAFMTLLPRFSVRKNLDYYDDPNYDRHATPTPVRFDVFDVEKPRWSTRTVQVPPSGDPQTSRPWAQHLRSVEAELMAEAKAWLAKLGYPEWEAFHLYWDVP